MALYVASTLSSLSVAAPMVHVREESSRKARVKTRPSSPCRERVLPARADEAGRVWSPKPSSMVDTEGHSSTGT